MSSDMLTHLLEGDIESRTESYKDIEIKKWQCFAETCRSRVVTSVTKIDFCNISNRKCSIDYCFAKNVSNHIKSGLL